LQRRWVFLVAWWSVRGVSVVMLTVWGAQRWS
jgi:hypothetical protein